MSPNTSIKFTYGPGFVSRPNIIPQLDRWYCYEYMLQANTPGQRDGRIAIWLDGVLVADFPGLRLRDVATLKIDRFGLSFHIGSNPNGQARKWYDNVVAAKVVHRPDRTVNAGARRFIEKDRRARHVFVTRGSGDSAADPVYTAGAKCSDCVGNWAPSRSVGKYRIVLPLGQGGTADVYLAVADGPSGFQKLVVVKVLRKSLASDADFRQMFLSARRGSPRACTTRTSSRPTRSSRTTARPCW